ncbi:Protein GrpE [Buchnera aphidicola (Eriosoma grossulariae)]|uniref:nucleotide exchange factor GrpE n=1 Tax=Buchnera aphidicola TaxID=9 RepID=UPI003463D66A
MNKEKINEHSCSNIDEQTIKKEQTILITQKEQKNNLKKEIIKFEKKIHDTKLRTQATIENIRKQSINNINQLKLNENKKFIKKIIPIIDDMQNIIQLNTNKEFQNNTIHQGLILTLKCLLDTLNKYGLQQEGCQKKIFNPKLHQTILNTENNVNDTQYIKSIEKIGYIFQKEILRKAIVTLE